MADGRIDPSQRFNCSLLEHRARPIDGRQTNINVTRRNFLALTASSLAASGIPPLFRTGGFSLVRTGKVLHIVTNNVIRWTIDPEMFGPDAALVVEKEENLTHILLRRAKFAGTNVAADFHCKIVGSSGNTKMSFRTSSGISVSADWLDWLHCRVPATGTWDPGTLQPIPGFSLSAHRPLAVTFTPNWTFATEGKCTVALERLARELDVNKWSLVVDHGERLAADSVGGHHASTFALHRGQTEWPVQLQRASEEGWHLSHDADPEIFDELRVEALETDSSPIYTALLKQDDNNARELRFFTGGGLFDGAGEPFHLPLRSTRVAISLEPGSVQSAVFAEIPDAVRWAHADTLSLAFGGAGTPTAFSLFDDSAGSCCPKVTPVVTAIQCKSDEDCTIKLTFDEPRKTPFNWAKIVQPIERLLAGLHLLPGEHKFAFDLSCGDVLSVVRPTDMLKLDFEFQNVRLVSGFWPKVEAARSVDPKKPQHPPDALFPPLVGEPELDPDKTKADANKTECSVGSCLPPLRPKKNAGTDKNVANCPQLRCSPTGGPPRVTVTFPPQHIQEQAFFHSDDNFDKPNSVGQVKAPGVGQLELKKWNDAGLKTTDVDPDAYNNGGKQTGDTVPVDAILSGETHLVFDFDLGEDGIRFELESLLDWSTWRLQVAEAAKGPGTLTPGQLAARPFNQFPDKTSTTSIEMPYRLFLSPHEDAKWAHSLKPVVGSSTAVELWHTRFAVKGPNGIDESNQKDRTARAIYSPDLKPDQTNGAGLDPHQGATSPKTEKRYPLDSRDREEIVFLTSDFAIKEPARYTPLPLQLDHLMLTPLGGYLKGIGVWEPPEIEFGNGKRTILTVEQWKNIATLGRDHYVRVVYKGYLAPFSHRASLVKETERKIVLLKDPDTKKESYYAILHQRMYIVVHEPRRDFPLYRQPNGARNFPFRRVDVLTTTTPDLEDPNSKVPSNPVVPVSQSLFWPTVGTQPFAFRFRFWDMENNVSEASLPVVFGDASVSQDPDGCKSMVNLYNAGSSAGQPTADDPWLWTGFSNQSVAFAPTNKPGDTRYDASHIRWKVCLDDLKPIAGKQTKDVAADLYLHNLPLFYPVIEHAKVTSPSIQRITGDSRPVLVDFFSDYVSCGFDHKCNSGEVVLVVVDPKLPQLSFGGMGKTDQAGGLSSPDVKVVGFSRKTGAVGGTPASQPTAQSSLSVFSKGTFSPADFFGGLTSAKLLGAVKLSDILQPLLGALESNLGDAPRMVQQVLFELAADADQLEDDVVKAIRAIQDVPHDPLAPRLASRAQSVYDAQAVRDKTSKSNALDLALAHAALIQAIIAYGEAAKTQLQDPASLLSDLAMDLVKELLNSQVFTNLSTAVQNVVTNLTAQATAGLTVLERLLTDVNAVLAFLNKLQQIADGGGGSAAIKVDDPLPLPQKDVPSDFGRAHIELRQLLPEVFSLLDLVPVCEDLITNLTQLKNTAASGNLVPPDRIAAIAGYMGVVGKDLLTLQQGLGVLGISIPTPDLATAAQKAQTALTKIWDTVLPSDLKAELDALQAACLVLAAQPEFPDAANVLQNLRQIQRTLDHIEALRESLADLRRKQQNHDPVQEAKWVFRWLQRLQQLQRQILESAAALQKAATTLLATGNQATDPARAAAVDLLSVLMYQADGKGLIQKITCLDALLLSADTGPSKTVETVVSSILGNFQDPNHKTREINSSLIQQLTTIRQSLNSARESLKPGPVQQHLQAYLDAKAAAITAHVDPVLDQAVKSAITTIIADNYDQIAAARQRLYDLAIRYQNCVASVTAWPLFMADKITATATSAITDLADAINVLASPLQNTLHQVSVAGKAVYSYVSTSGDLAPLLAEIFAPLNSLPDPQAGAPISELLDDARMVMSATSTVVSNVRNGIKVVTDEVQSLANIKSLPDLIAKLPLPTKISFSYTWHPKIKSFEPVFLLDDGAEFSIAAKFEENALDVTHPTYDITAQLTKFSINLIGSPSFVILKVSKLEFTAKNGNKPDCRLTIDKVLFGKDMSFVQELAQLLNPQNGPFIEFAGTGVRAGFRFHIPTTTVGIFTLMQLALEVAVQLSFDGSPVRCQIGISDQTHPFLLSAGIYGGGGFLQLHLGLDGVELLQGALEFGVVAAISIGPLQGSGFVVAGIYFRIGGKDAKVCGFVHAHGHMDILGLISMDIDVYVGLCYNNGSVQGTATFTVSVHILFFSEDFSFQASYQFAGSPQSASLNRNPDTQGYLYANNARMSSHPGSADVEEDEVVNSQAWARYYDAFAA